MLRPTDGLKRYHIIASDSDLRSGWLEPKTFIYKYAVSDEIGEVNFNCHSESAFNSFYEVSTGGYYQKRGVQLLENAVVATTTLDSLVFGAGINQVDVLKIDAQGNTSTCLQGAKKLLKDRTINFVQAEIFFLVSMMSVTR